MSFLKRIFTWWNGSTIGTNLQIRRKAREVGSDEYGNKYFEQKANAYDGRLRRWVTYTGYADASRGPPEWQGWLNYTRDKAPTNSEKMHDWQKEHQPNLTGTVHAYRPKGSLARGGKRSKTASDYESWSPDD